MSFIRLEIKSCRECPKLKTDRIYTGDSWDDVESWICLENNKEISSYVEWRDNPNIPKWCPLRIN